MKNSVWPYGNAFFAEYPAATMEKVKARLKLHRRYFFREWRKYRNLTQEALAARVGLSTSGISQLETGKQGFTDATLEVLSKALGCEPGDLLMRNPLDDSAVWSLQEKLRAATPEQRRQAFAIVTTLLSTGTDG